VYNTTAGTGTDVYETNGVYKLDLSLSSGDTWNTSIALNSWQTKCDLAKAQIGSKIKKMLSQYGLRDADTTSGLVLDYVWNTDELVTPDDYLALHLIYVDLQATMPNNEAYASKADYYMRRYEETMQDAVYQLTYGDTAATAVPINSVYGTRLQV